MRRRLIRNGTILVVLGAMAAGTLSLRDKEFEWQSAGARARRELETASGKSDLPCFTVKLGTFTITVATGVVEPARTEDVMCPVQGRGSSSRCCLRGRWSRRAARLRDRLVEPQGPSRRPEGHRKEGRRAVNLPEQAERFPLYAPADGTVQWGGGRSRFDFFNERLRVKPGDTVRRGSASFSSTTTRDPCA